MHVPRAKICGLMRHEDAAHAWSAGATYGGVILAPGGRRTVAPARARDLYGDVSLRRVGVFVDPEERTVRTAAATARLHVVQLHGDEPVSLVRALRADGFLHVWKAVRVREADDFLRALDRFGEVADGLLLDGYSAAARGGTGTSFPWAEVAPFRDRVPTGVQLILAGGLNAGNVARAVAELRPDVVDVSSGVEISPGQKDPDLISAFMDAVAASSAAARRS